jgi:DNA ligase (NAD+)
MNKVLEFLEVARKAYYEGNPIISDEQYDALEERYGEAEKPGYALDKGVPHLFPMYSLKKYYEGEDELPDWGNTSVSITYKLDGAACSLVYINGEFASAITRGNGEKGLEFTHLLTPANLAKLGIPRKLHSGFREKVYQISGEIVAPKVIPNARNYAAGAISLKCPTEFHSRDLHFVAYDCYPRIEVNHISAMHILRKAGLTEGFSTVCDGADLEKFPTDGLVYRIDKYQRFASLGYTSKHPRGAFALKQRTEGIRTQLLDVIWQTGKSGKVTPVAILEPIEIDGAIVSRATLNNVGFIESLGVEIGDYVQVERSGGIIPRIICKADDQQKNNP